MKRCTNLTTNEAEPAESRRQAEPVPGDRNLEDLWWWRVFSAGIERDQLNMVNEWKWNFSNLEEALKEAQLPKFKDQSEFTMVPVVVAVVSPFPPSDKVGIIAGLDISKEVIVPMKQMEMDWVPYITPAERASQAERLEDTQIFILSCSQRSPKIEPEKEVVPYIYDPFEDKLEHETVVKILYPIDPVPVLCFFDWECDELEELADKLVKDEELTADQKEEFKSFVKVKVGEAKKASDAALETCRKAQEEMSQQVFEDMRFYKFYPRPSPETPDVEKVSFINRYYGHAHIDDTPTASSEGTEQCISYHAPSVAI